MTWMPAVWFVVGLVLGLLHAKGISRAARQGTLLNALLGLFRLLLVGLTLATVAYFGGIVSAAVGWAVAFFVTVAVITTRWRTDPRSAAT